MKQIIIDSKSQTILASLLGGVFALFVLHICFDGIGDILKANESANWKQVPATIVSSEMIGECYVKNSTCELNLEYVYVVYGQKHHGDRLFIGDKKASSVARAQSYGKIYMSRYPVNTQTFVYYDPQRPQNSVLEKGVSKRSFSRLIAGILLAVESGLIVVISVAAFHKANTNMIGLAIAIPCLIVHLFISLIFGLLT
jgi:hypothetical protein